jgi:hypothetical protein
MNARQYRTYTEEFKLEALETAEDQRQERSPDRARPGDRLSPRVLALAGRPSRYISSSHGFLIAAPVRQITNSHYSCKRYDILFRRIACIATERVRITP